MGGYGALSLAIEYPEVFGALAALGPAIADFEAPPTEHPEFLLSVDAFIEANPTLEEPILAHDAAELASILGEKFFLNLFYALGSAYTPNPDNPPYYVDLPVQYPEAIVRQDVWDQWLERDLVSQIERDGHNLMNTDIYIDRGVGPVVMMPEVVGINLLPAALDAQGVAYTYAESDGDHLTHIRAQLTSALKFLSPSGAWPIDGAWMMRTITDWGPVLEPIIFIAQDNIGQRYTMLAEDAECDYTLGGMFPTAKAHSHLVGVCVRTGPYTFETTVVGFVVERGPDAPDKTLYQRVVTHAFQFVDENNIVASSSWGHYMPDQDADHGGFPDPGQEPFDYFALETTMKRVVLVPPCEG